MISYSRPCFTELDKQNKEFTKKHGVCDSGRLANHLPNKRRGYFIIQYVPEHASTNAEIGESLYALGELNSKSQVLFTLGRQRKSISCHLNLGQRPDDVGAPLANERFAELENHNSVLPSYFVLQSSTIEVAICFTP